MLLWQIPYVLSRRNIAFALLIVSVAGIATFIQGFRLIDTIVVLVCGAIAGCCLADISMAARLPRAVPKGKEPPRIKT